MKRALLILLAAASVASAQTYLTVTADTNRVIRTNFSMAIEGVTGLQAALDGKLGTNSSLAISNVTGLQSALDGKLATNSSLSAFPAGLLRTNGDGSGLTNLPNANLSNAIGVLPVINGGSGATNSGAARTNFGLTWSGLTNSDAAGFRSALSLGSAATNDSASFQPANANLTNLAANNAGSLTNFPASLLRTNGDGSGLTNIAVFPSYTNNAKKILAVTTNETGVEWIAVSNTVTDASTLTNFPSFILQTNSSDGSFPSFLLRTNGSAAGLTNFPASVLQPTNVRTARMTLISDSNNSVVWANKNNFFQQLEVYVDNGASTNSSVQFGLGAEVDTISSTNNNSVAVGRLATIGGGSGNSVAIGYAADVDGSTGSVALGANSEIRSTNSGLNYSVAIGDSAIVNEAGYAVQLSRGTNSNSYTIQFYDAGSVTTNQWAALANSTTFGHYIMQAPINGTANQVLALNSNATAVVWTANSGSGTANLTNVTNTLGLANGGTGGTNATTALQNLGVITLSETRLGPGATSGQGSGLGSVALGRDSFATNGGIAAGYQARSTGLGGAVGYQATNNADGAVMGYFSRATSSAEVAMGRNAVASGVGSVQLGVGSNTNTNTIQFLSAGSVGTNSWSALANSSTQGRYAMTNTAGISGSKTFVAYDGTNYSTNTVTFSNGIITGWTP